MRKAHPTFGRVHVPSKHRRNVRSMHTVARSMNPPDRKEVS